jgi:hypothetical protein
MRIDFESLDVCMNKALNLMLHVHTLQTNDDVNQDGAGYSREGKMMKWGTGITGLMLHKAVGNS